MEQVFSLKVELGDELEKLLKWYTQSSQTSKYVRSEIMKEHQSGKGSRLVGMSGTLLAGIVCSRPSENPRSVW